MLKYRSLSLASDRLCRCHVKLYVVRSLHSNSTPVKLLLHRFRLD
ncbi:hypothetical protein [Desmonostoc muscorum]|nr:hypothetical protein [Desmonostoc muscorum]